MSRKKYFTPRDVDHLIPQLEEIFGHMDECRTRAGDLANHAVAAAQNKELHSDPQTRDRVHFLLAAVEDDVQHIQRLGGITKDLDQGLVDFPGQVEGQEVWLCWKRGETKIRYWHALDQGYTERQALRRSEPNTTTFH